MIAMTKVACSRIKTHFTSRLNLNLRKKLVKCYIWNTVLYSAFGKQKYLDGFKMCWRRTEKISWTDGVRDFKYYTESRRRGISCIQ
jgi:hypothetical protein